MHVPRRCAVVHSTFWKLTLSGPESPPYAGGCWLLYIQFPPNFPASPPEVRGVRCVCGWGDQGLHDVWGHIRAFV